MTIGCALSVSSCANQRGTTTDVFDFIGPYPNYKLLSETQAYPVTWETKPQSGEIDEKTVKEIEDLVARLPGRIQTPRVISYAYPVKRPDADIEIQMVGGTILSLVHRKGRWQVSHVAWTSH
jgi:hypothetical protein